MRAIAAGAVLVTALAACRSGDADAPPDPGARARGRALFVAHCALCHGERADGRGARREGLAGTPSDFASPAFHASATRQGVVRAIRDGKPGTSMPAWRSLDDREIADVAAYVLSVHDEGP